MNNDEVNVKVTTKADTRGTDEAARSLNRLEGDANGLENKMRGMVGTIKRFTTLIAGTGTAALGAGVAVGFKFNSAVEQAEVKMQAFTKDAKLTAETLAWVKSEAAKTQFSFTDMAEATASLIPTSKMARVNLQDLVRQAEILAALNPAEGLTGAAFALREAMSGDWVSIVERFNLPRVRINELKEQGIPAMEIISKVMKEMGVDFDLVSKQGQTTAARWDQIKDRFTIMAGTITKPVFSVVSSSLDKLAGSAAWKKVEEKMLNLSTRVAGSMERIIKAFEDGGIIGALNQFKEEVNKGLEGLDLGNKLISLIESIRWEDHANKLALGFIGMLSAIDWATVTATAVPVLVKAASAIVEGLVMGIIQWAKDDPLNFAITFASLIFMPAKWVKAIGASLKEIPLLGTLFGWMFEAISFLPQMIGGPIRNFFGSAGRMMVGSIKDGIAGAWHLVLRYIEDLLGGLLSRFRSIGSGIANALSGPAEAIKSVFRAAFNFISDAWNNTVGKVNFTVPSWVPGVGGKGWSVPKIPKFAGGVENFGGGLAYVHKGEVLANLPPGTDVIPRNRVDNMMRSDNRNITVNVYPQTAEAAHAIWNDLDNDTILLNKGLTPVRGGAA
jgi:hypothetical protein